jgi:hypothetical protein
MLKQPTVVSFRHVLSSVKVKDVGEPPSSVIVRLSDDRITLKTVMPDPVAMHTQI